MDNWLALTTAFLAVFAAVTTMFMGKYSNRAILIQGQESDQWAYYQAKSIKGHTYEIQKQKLELELAAQQMKMPASAVDKYKNVIANFGANITRYEKEKAEIKVGAEKLAGQKIGVQNISANLSYSLIFLQIAIVLSSVAAITKKKPLWYFGLGTVLGWVVFLQTHSSLFFSCKARCTEFTLTGILKSALFPLNLFYGKRAYYRRYQKDAPRHLQGIEGRCRH